MARDRGAKCFYLRTFSDAPFLGGDLRWPNGPWPGEKTPYFTAKPVTWPDMAFGHLTPSALAGAPWRAGGSKLGDGLVPWRRGLYNQPPVNPARRSPVTTYGQRPITLQ